VKRRTLTIGTRGSALALAQTELVRSELARREPALDLRVERITTTGDRLSDRPLLDVPAKGVFVAEIEQALLDGRIDLAVHSAKDLPAVLPASLTIAAFPLRADPRDVLVSPAGTLESLKAGSRVGTSSPRRACQVAAARPDLVTMPIRGNVDTRLAKLAAGSYDAIVLAAAGLIRLRRTDVVTEWLSPEVMLPAVGQGALALQIRADDDTLRPLIEPLGDPATTIAVRAERAFLRRLGVGCAAAAGAYARVAGDSLTVTGLIGSTGGRLVSETLDGATSEPEAIGDALAAGLLARGGASFLLEADTARAGIE
jgi:hydroxymethylbilane synthase